LQVNGRRLVGSFDRVGPTLPLLVVQAPFEALNSDQRHSYGNALIGRRSKPGLDSAHADAQHPYVFGIHIGSGDQIIHDPPEAVRWVEVERFFLLLKFLFSPRTNDSFVVFLCPVRSTRYSLAMIASIDSDG